MSKILLTQAALDKVNLELEEFIAKRKAISEEIKTARAFGDLSENAEYHAAREEQSHNETEILKLKNIIDNHELVFEDEFSADTVHINSVLKVKFVEDNEIETVKIVTQVEADPFNNHISNESPVGAGLLGKKAGDTVVVTTPGGNITLEVIELDN